MGTARFQPRYVVTDVGRYGTVVGRCCRKWQAVAAKGSWIGENGTQAGFLGTVPKVVSLLRLERHRQGWYHAGSPTCA